MEDKKFMFMCHIEKKNRIPLWGDLLLLILGFFFGALIAEECTLSLLGSTGYENDHYYLLSAILSCSMVSLVVLFLHCIIDRRPLSELGLCSFNKLRKFSKIIILWTVIVFTLGLIICILSGSANISAVQLHWKDLSLSLIMFIFGAFYEEILIRGYLLTRLYRSGLNIWISLIITSLIFSALHLANPDMSICSAVNLFLGGFFDGCIFLLTGSLWTAVISHCAWNWLQGSIFGFNVSGGEFYQSLITLEYPSYNLINGGLFGFEGSIICTILLLPSVFVLMKLVSKNLKKTE